MMKFGAKEAKSNFMLDAIEIAKQSNSDTKPNLGSMQYFIDKYCNYEADGKVLIDNQKYQDKLKYKGIKVLITDCIEDAQQAYLAYNCQQTIANNFQKAKFSLKDPRSSVGSQQFVNGKLLIDLIASSLEVTVSSISRYFSPF